MKKPKRIIAPDNDQSDEMMEEIRGKTGSTLLTQPYTPTAQLISHKKLITKVPTTDYMDHPTKTKRNIQPMSERIEYNIADDVLKRKANIDMKDLLIAAPSLKRDLVKEIRNTKFKKSNTLAFVEDDDVDTTAIYTTIYIEDHKVKAILDTGRSKTVMSKQLAETIGLEIDAPSTSIFTLGNGSKQAALGIIYDVPLNIGGKLIIPGSIEVLPVCPTQLIIGNNWMKRAKARLNLEDKTIKVEYKNNTKHIPFVFTRGAEAPVVIKSNKSVYYSQEKNDIGPVKPVVSDTDESDEISSEDEDDGDIDTDYLDPEGTTDDEYDDQLMLLEDEYDEVNHYDCNVVPSS